MRRVCFVTCLRWPEVSESDGPVQRALETRGVAVEARAWNDPAFVEEIRTQGEWSLVFIDGAFTHAVLKHPARHDFRVQPRLGGRAEAAMPRRPFWRRRRVCSPPSRCLRSMRGSMGWSAKAVSR
jgi:hypothetical protein